MDKIKIINLEVFCYHGVNKEENILGQKFLVSATLYNNIQKESAKDDVDYCINYAKVCHFIKEIMEKNTFKLIETVAEKVARGLLVEYRSIKKVKIEIKKPWAPILLPIESVSVKIKRSWNRAYIALGSNMGDKEKNIKSAIAKISEDKECNITKVSEFIITEPVGYTDQDKFLNGCLELYTLKSPFELLEFLQSVEKGLGRERTITWGPRTIDLDILLYKQLCINSDSLVIPHIEMANRSFVLEPLSLIAPDVVHPVLNEKIKDLKDKVMGCPTKKII